MNKPILLDGAVGTTLWHLADAAGVKREPVWKYNIEHPELVSELHKRYIEAGTEIMLTNTFGANRQMVSRSPYAVSEVVHAGVRLAKEAVKGTNVRLAAACGPLKDFMEPYGDLEEYEVEDMFTELIGSAVDEGVDMVMVQTFLDLDSALVACRVAKKLKKTLFCTLTFEKTGKTLMGNSVEKVCKALEEVGADGVGMNCSLGPNMALPIISEFKKYTSLPLVFKPNAGLPITSTTGDTVAPYTPEMFLEEVRPALDFVSYIGGCCNTDSEYIRLLRREIDGGT